MSWGKKPSQETLLTTEKFKVERRTFTSPDGQAIEKTLVIHPGAVLILPVLDPERIVMVMNFRYTAERELLELPAGTLEPNEAPEACAARELTEETGYSAGRIQPLCQFYTTPGFTDEFMYAFVAYDLAEGQQDLDENERVRPVIMDLNDAIKGTLDGRIIDGKTIAALHVYRSRFEGMS